MKELVLSRSRYSVYVHAKYNPIHITFHKCLNFCSDGLFFFPVSNIMVCSSFFYHVDKQSRLKHPPCRLHSLPLNGALRNSRFHHSDSVYTMGSAWQSTVWKHRPASINIATGSHPPSGPINVQADYQGSVFIISPTPCHFPPPPHDTTRLGRSVLKSLGQHNQGPSVAQSLINTEQFDPVHQRAASQHVGKIKCSYRQSPCMREVSDVACDWANWNQQPWLDT